MYRISVTTVEQYRKYVTGKIDLDSFTKTIKGEFITNPKIEYGSAYHKLIELKPRELQKYRVRNKATGESGYAINRNWIPDRLANQALAFKDAYPLMASEIKLEYPVLAQETQLVLVGKVDGIEGLMLHEHKTTWNYNPDSYLESLQWRFYLNMMEADTLQYNIFEIKGKDVGEIESIELQSFKVHSYPSLASDCQNWMERFWDCITSLNLQSYLFKQPK